MKKAQELEQITKGFANKQRISILALLYRQRDLDVAEISEHINLGYKSTSEHLRKMHEANLVTKEDDGNYVLHRLTPLGKRVFTFLSGL